MMNFTKGMVLLAVAGTILALAGCSTVQGFGKDVEKAGEAIQKSSTK